MEEFCGWTPLLELINHASTLRDKAFLTTLFQTGGRVSEVLALTTQNFIPAESEGVIIVRDMVLLKRYKKLEETTDEEGKKCWITEKLQTKRRQFPIVLAEPLTPVLLEWLENTGSLLFPSPYKLGYALTRFWGYKLVRRLDEEISRRLKDELGLNRPFLIGDRKVSSTLHLWLQWFRSQRDSQLVRDYGFEVIDLIKYFSWEKYETALHYAQKGWKDLASKMQSRKVSYT